MIISASRRTDIPALYPEWFMNRVRAGFCTVPRPRNRKVHDTVSLRPADVGAMVFWTRNPAPLLPHLGELERQGLGNFMFLFTLLDYPEIMEPGLPPKDVRIRTFRELASRIGPERVVWRYDPIVISRTFDAKQHLKSFAMLANSLEGSTNRCIISVAEDYPGNRSRLARLETHGLAPDFSAPGLHEIMEGFAKTASRHGMEISCCSQPEEVTALGIENAPCIDGERINRLFKTSVPCNKDGGQRARCRCTRSRDIGAYDTCTHGCLYCYANADFGRSTGNHREHDPEATSLTGSPQAQLPLLKYT